jgi:DNA (cytosine-5)-methyltransferase 1
MKPRLLDLFCGAGGAGMGYHRAGFEVVGVDINPQPNYPFEFVRGDAMRSVMDLFRKVGRWDAIHASPPCQMYSSAMRHLAKPQPMLIDAVRDMLVDYPVWVIENVVGAPIPEQSTWDGRHGIRLCGGDFGLRVARHRLFETSIPLMPTEHRHPAEVMNPHNQRGRDRIYAEFGRQDPEAIWRKEMGVEWMGRYEAREAIPPAYTEHIGRQLLAAIQQEQAA